MIIVTIIVWRPCIIFQVLLPTSHLSFKRTGWMDIRSVQCEYSGSKLCLRSLKLCLLEISFAQMSWKGRLISLTSVSAQPGCFHLLALPLHASQCSLPTHPCPWLPHQAGRGCQSVRGHRDYTSQLVGSTHSLWVSECSMVRAQMKPQLPVRTQNDPASFEEENSVKPPQWYSTRQPQTLALRVTGRGGGPKVHRTFKPEGNFEMPLLKSSPDSQENQALTGRCHHLTPCFWTLSRMWWSFFHHGNCTWRWKKLYCFLCMALHPRNYAQRWKKLYPDNVQKHRVRW